jgi:hypothetical protein
MPCARVRSTLALVALLALTLPALPVRADTTVTDPTNTFRIQVPDSWQPDTILATGVVLVSYHTTNPDGVFTVAAPPLMDVFTAIPPDPQVIVQFLQQANAAVQIQNVSDVTVAGAVGSEIDSSQPDGAGNVLAGQQLFVGHNGRVYMLVFGARPGDIDAVRAAGASILASWQWLG